MAKGEKTGGRKEGTPNKVTRSMKETLQDTLAWLQLQPRSNMREWANENPTEFYRIASKLLPTEINANVQSVVINFKDAE
jgi:hypothetical protein